MYSTFFQECIHLFFYYLLLKHSFVNNWPFGVSCVSVWVPVLWAVMWYLNSVATSEQMSSSSLNSVARSEQIQS